jgi:class 3 adenylate cyclase
LSLGEDLKRQVAEMFGYEWSSRVGLKVPEPAEVAMGNAAVKLEGTVLYADLRGSTALVDHCAPYFAAEIYKSFLHCAAKIIKRRGGVITAYDGDRIMAVFIGEKKNTSAARAAFGLHYAVDQIINPALVGQYGEDVYQVEHVVGIDAGTLYAARTGIRGSNDLVWVGRAANYAAKLTELTTTHSTWITVDVFRKLHQSMRLSDSQVMWDKYTWPEMSNMEIFGSHWWWSF